MHATLAHGQQTRDINTTTLLRLRLTLLHPTNVGITHTTATSHSLSKQYKNLTRLRKTQSKCFWTKIPLPYVPPHLTRSTPHASHYSATNTHQLISQCTSHFKIGNDTASLLRISDSLSTLSTFRTQHLQSLQSSLTQLSRTHQTLNANHSHTISQHNAIDHASEILRLDTEKFKIAKQASDLEIEGERLQQELSRLGSVAGELDEEGVEGGVVERPGEDATV
jgi:hypothetical protein